MASLLKATVTGRKAVLQALRAIGDGAEDIVVEAVTRGVDTFKAEVVRRAPVGDGSKRAAGSMRSKIGVNVKRKNGYASAHVITPPEAVFTEYGFLHARSGKRIPAEPWIRPSFDSKAPQVEAAALAFMAGRIESLAQQEAGRDA